MKKMILICMGLFTAALVFAQAPAAFKYQAVARNSSGTVLSNQRVNFRISILQGSVSGTSVYNEQHAATTNEFGLVNLEIGRGTSAVGSFGAIKWGDAEYFVKVEMDPAGGTAFQAMGTSQLLSVPYALNAKTMSLPFSGSAPVPETVFKVTNTVTAGGTAIMGESSADGGTGVTGINRSATGNTYGVVGLTNSPSGFAGYFQGRLYAQGFTGIGTPNPNAGLHIKSAGYPGSFIFLEANPQQDAGIRIYEGTSDKWHIFHNSTKMGLQIYNHDVQTAFFARDADGWVGIGTTEPQTALDVAGSLNICKGQEAGGLSINGHETIHWFGDHYSWGFGGSNYNVFQRPVVIGDVAQPGNYKLVVIGDAAKSGGGSWSTWSDSRLKDIHGDYSRGINDIMSLHPISYSYKKGNPVNLPFDREYFGLVAEEVREAFPEAVTEGSDGYLRLDMNPINIALINALKELKTENDRLKERLEKVEHLLGAEAKR